jgi:Putative prokaryotic signal transducing protein
MRKVHTAESMIEIAHLRNVLESAGIRCLVRNERLAGALGEIPFVECWPELWVCEPGQALRARGLIDEARCPAPPADPWECPSCGERIEAQFAQCWRCAPGPDAAGRES